MLEKRVQQRFRTRDVNATARVIEAIKRRLDALGMTGRAFGRGFSANDGRGHGDQWVSNLLKGRHRLSLDELDEAARILKCTPAELVKTDFETAEYLSPTERRIVQALRTIPAVIRDHFLVMAEYLVGIAPEEIGFLEEYRELTESERTRVRHWIHVTRTSRDPLPELAILHDSPEKAAQPLVGARRIPGRRPKDSE